MLVTSTSVGGMCKKLRLNSQASATNSALLPKREPPPMASRLPPMCTVGSCPISSSICAIMADTVVLPCVPHTHTVLSYPRISCPKSTARSICGMPKAAAAWRSASPGEMAAE